jgi:hypothetical protein
MIIEERESYFTKFNKLVENQSNCFNAFFECGNIICLQLTKIKKKFIEMKESEVVVCSINLILF